MIPETAGAVLGLLLVIGPGLAFEVIREHYRPTAERSAFREGTSVALASLVFTATALIILAIVRAVWPSALPDPQRWLENGNEYVLDHYRLVAGFLLALVVLSTGLSCLIAWVWFRSRGGRIDPNATGWYEVFRKRAPKTANPMVRVQLRDGTEYQGLLVFYSANILPAERELALGPPIQRRRPADTELTPLPDESAWARVLVQGESIESFWVRYAPKEPDGGRPT